MPRFTVLLLAAMVAILALATMSPRPALAAASITVDTDSDENVSDSVLSIREAILLANDGTGASGLNRALHVDEADNVVGSPGAGSADTITFADPPFISGTPGIITISEVLPSLLGGNDTIDGTGRGVILDAVNVEPGQALFNCLNLDSGNNTVKGVQMTDCSIGVLIVADWTGNTVGPGNTIYDNENGIAITGNNNTIKGNKIGTNIDGTNPHPDGGNSFYGIAVSGDNNTIGGTTAAERNIISGNTSGINVTSSANGNSIIGNYIGTDITGALDKGNANHGIFVAGDGNFVGGTGAGEGNVISGNGLHGVSIGTGGSSNSIRGNIIGLDAAGANAVPNSSEGIQIASNLNTVGGTDPGARNIISGNTLNGVSLTTVNATGNTVLGNYIGTDITGTLGLGNGSSGVSLGAAVSNTIGGTAAGSANVIAYNGDDGVFVQAGMGNAIRSNVVHSNTGLGIDLGTDGVTVNDVNTGDADAGANNLQNFPVLSGVTLGVTDVTIDGTLDSALSTSFDIQFFSSPSCDGSGNGEGATFLGTLTDSTDTGGDLAFSALLPVVVPAGRFITATATDPSKNTSEFSACIPSLDDADDDDDGFADAAEVACGSNKWDGSSLPERLDGVFDNVDDDGDMAIDEALPGGAEAYDCDGDGFVGSIEMAIGTEQQAFCTGGSVADAWPLDNTLDGFANVNDVLAYRGKVPSAVDATHPKRLDLDNNNFLNVNDVLLYRGKLPSSCV